MRNTNCSCTEHFRCRCIYPWACMYACVCVCVRESACKSCSFAVENKQGGGGRAARQERINARWAATCNAVRGKQVPQISSVVSFHLLKSLASPCHHSPLHNWRQTKAEFDAARKSMQWKIRVRRFSCLLSHSLSLSISLSLSLSVCLSLLCCCRKYV